VVVVVLGTTASVVVVVVGPFPAEFTPEVGVLVGVAAGRLVIGVGTGGNGLFRTAAIMSVSPASDWL
jgi:hypothetical protein